MTDETTTPSETGDSAPATDPQPAADAPAADAATDDDAAAAANRERIDAADPVGRVAKSEPDEEIPF